MRFCIFTEPHRGARYDQQLRVARHAEQAGFEGFFRADHYRDLGNAEGLPGPTDSWMTLAGLAVQTSQIRLGTLVTSATFRLPGPLAIAVSQVDQMSGGRVDLGIGTGWYPPEHAAYGIEFPSLAERFDRLAEQLAVLTGLWSGGQFSYEGKYYRLTDAPTLPGPRPPIIVGGRGTRRTPALAARYADEFNVPFTTLAKTADQYARVADAGPRRPLVLSAAILVACGRTPAEVRARADKLHENSALPPESPLIGTPAQIVDQIGRYAEAGASRVYIAHRDLTDLDHLDLIASSVLPQLV